MMTGIRISTTGVLFTNADATTVASRNTTTALRGRVSAQPVMR